MANPNAAAEVRAILAQQERSIEWLARQSGIHPTTLGRKVRGKVSFTVDDLLAIAPPLNTTASAIIEALNQEPSAA